MRTRRSPRNQERLWRALGATPARPAFRFTVAFAAPPTIAELHAQRLDLARAMSSHTLSTRARAVLRRQWEAIAARIAVAETLAKEPTP